MYSSYNVFIPLQLPISQLCPPDLLAGLCPWTPLGAIKSPDPLLCPQPWRDIDAYDRRCNDDCLEDKRENYQICFIQYCVQQLYTVQCTHMNRPNSRLVG